MFLKKYRKGLSNCVLIRYFERSHKKLLCETLPHIRNLEERFRKEKKKSQKESCKSFTCQLKRNSQRDMKRHAEM